MLKTIALAGVAAVLVIGSIAAAQDTQPTMNNNQGSGAATAPASDNNNGGQTATDPNASGAASATQSAADTSATAGERG